jgi:hypothetical protein
MLLEHIDEKFAFARSILKKPEFVPFGMIVPVNFVDPVWL